jgi:hypothetical protein
MGKRLMGVALFGTVFLVSACGLISSTPPTAHKPPDPVDAPKPALGPLKPYTHEGNPETDEEIAARLVVWGLLEKYRMKQDVSWVCWGPHDLKGQSANVLKADNYVVLRVRYRYQIEGEAAVEKDELYKLTPAIISEINKDKIPLGTLFASPIPGGFRHDNPEGGLWLEIALKKKADRETGK